MADFTDRKKGLLIYNLKAGMGTLSDDLFEGIEYLTRNGYEMTLYPIVPSAGIVSEDIIRDTKGRFDLIMVCGGDGTLNHAINGILGNGMDTPIAYVPVGSTNDFSKSIYGAGHHSVSDIVRYVVEGKKFSYDAGKFNDSHFNYIAAFGSFPQVSYTTPQDLKNNLGYMAYVLNFLAAVPDGLNYKTHCVITHDGIREEGDFMVGFITNSISVAGTQPGLIKRSSLNDGIFEATLIKANLNPIQAADVVHALNSDNPHSDNVVTFRMKECTLEFDRDVPWTLDGEDGGVTRRVDLSVVPEAITVYVAKD